MRALALAAGALAFAAAASARVLPQGASAVCLNDAGALPVANARLFGFGPYKAPRVSANDRAQQFFNQGMVFGWGFNFAEAVRSFRAATLADLDCAMCRWGIAWALGPSVNHDMAPADVPIALDAIAQARAYAPDPGSRERQLIDALARRYRADAKADSDRLARDYAQAMRSLARVRPDDADIAVLAAEALMNAHPYDYWTKSGAPHPWTREIDALLTRALQIAPDHPGAHHYKIHLYEESSTPQHAFASAQKLGALAPAVGHLVHMPAHIDLRLGRYHEAVVANRAAIAADRDYLAAVQASPAYAADYVPHNLHYLWAAALASGEGAVAGAAADELAAAGHRLPDEPARAGTRQHLEAAPWLTDVRFARWDAVLERSSLASADTPYLAGLERFARGMAFTARGDLASAKVEAERLEEMQTAARQRALKVKNINRADALLAIARALLAAEIAVERGDVAAAARHARTAVAAEDALAVDEPAAWQIPARLALGRILLVGGRAREARDAYLADLTRRPENAPALIGLAVAERRLGNPARAAALDRRARAAWSHADVPLPQLQLTARAQR